MITESIALSQQLKDATSDLHRDAEGSQFQRSLVRGEVGPESYALWLRQMEEIHRRLEDGLPSLVAAKPALSSMADTRFIKTAHIQADLTRFDPARSTPVLPATEKFSKRIGDWATNSPLSLLGVNYVLEGSMNGGRFIARAVRKSLSIGDGEPGARYLDPYGDEQKGVWAEFKATLDSVELSDAERELVLEAAAETFRAVAEVSDELNQR